MKSKKLLAATAVTTMLATSVVPTSVLANKRVEKEKESSSEADSLHGQIIEAEKHREETKEQFEKAKTAIDEKGPMLKDAQNKVNNKKEALDKLVGQLQQDLDKELVKQQTIIDETSDHLIQLKNEKETIERQIEEAKNEYAKALNLLEKKEMALKAAEEAAKGVTEEMVLHAHATVKAAEEDVANAQAEYLHTVELRDQAKKQLQLLESEAIKKAKEVELETQKLNVAKDEQEKARINQETAQANYDQLHGSDAEEKIKEELKNATDKYDDAKKAVINQKKVVSEAKAVYEKNNTELKNIQASLLQAEEMANEKQSVYASLQKDLMTAVQEKDAIEKKLDLSQREREQLQHELEEANMAYTQAKNAADRKQQDVSKAENDLNSLEKEINQLTEKLQKKDMRGFLEYIGHSDSVKMLDELLKLSKKTGERWKDIIHLEEDGMTLSQMENALSHIEEANAIRRELKLPEFKVSSALMLTSWFNSHYCKYIKFEHCGTVLIQGTHPAENLTTATKDLYQGWYYNEKALFDQYVKSGQFPGLDQMDPYTIQKKYSTIYPYIGHYLNLARPKHVVTGFASSDNYISSQTFWLEDNLSDTLTVSEYRQKIEEFKKSLAIDDKLANLKKQYEENKKKFDQITKEEAQLRQEANNQKADLDKKDLAFRENAETIHKNQQMIEKINRQITDTRSKSIITNKELLEAQAKKETLRKAEKNKIKENEGILEKVHDAELVLKKNENLQAIYLSEKEKANEKADHLKDTIKASEKMLDEAIANNKKKDEIVKTIMDSLASKKMDKRNIDTLLETTKKDIDHKELDIAEKSKMIEQKDKEKEDAFAVIEEYNALIDTLSKAEDAYYIQGRKTFDIQENIQQLDNKKKKYIMSMQDMDKLQSIQQKRKALLNALNQEFQKIKTGMHGLLLDSDDAFVNAFQANYPKLWIAINEYEQAQKALAMLEKESASDQEAYAMAKKAYQDADMKLNALLDRMNKELNSEVEQENKKEMQKDPSGVQTAAANDSAVWALSFASAAGAWAVIERKRKTVK